MARRSRRSNASGLPYLAVGLALGLAVAAGVYFSDLRSGLGVPAASSDGARAPAQRPAPAVRADARATGGENERAGASDAATEQPQAPVYDFYEQLPRYEVVVPEAGERPAAPPAAAAPVDAPGRYVLQTGSFRSHADADRMQASLALLGIEARIQKVAIDDQEYHRVRIGPLGNLDELNRIRALLQQSEIDSLLMKVD